ncbi:MAG: methionyl-tRNA formyltransferase [Parcubacteria group bacterium Gr01-1014_2]|nr:MAG: methionyl-tRNA formyltransferase [Parcubacteria group bacterium Gr01-1014_2]
MKLIFFGTSDFSRPVFEALKKKGHSPILWNLENSFQDFKNLKPDICVVAAYGKIIPKEWLEVPKYGFLNVHPSLLPKYRGASPIQTTILNGDAETGVTIILMDEKVDHGPIIAKSKIQISKSKNYRQLERELAELGAELLIEILPKWTNGKIKPKEQNHSGATYTKKFSWIDGKIDWSKPAVEIDRQIRALNPEPGTWTLWKSRVLKIFNVQTVKSKLSEAPGRVMNIENQILVKCGLDVLILKEIQLEGRKLLSIKDFINGHKDFIGSELT